MHIFYSIVAGLRAVKKLELACIHVQFMNMQQEIVDIAPQFKTRHASIMPA